MGVTFQRKAKVSKQCSGMRSWLIMAGCFPEFRPRTSSFDLHTLATANRLARIGKLFRSRSEDAMKTGSASPKGSPKDSPGTSPGPSPKGSPKGSPSGPPRRRFMRVVRNNDKRGEEYVNPHVIRKYNPEFLQEQQSRLQKSRSLEEGDRPLPYTVTGHTILKKHPSLDMEAGTSPGGGSRQPGDRHACFKEEVEILAYDKKGRSEIMHDKLNDSEDEDFYSATSRDVVSDSDTTTPDESDLLDELGDVFEDCQDVTALEPIPETSPLVLPAPHPNTTTTVDAELSSCVDRIKLEEEALYDLDKNSSRSFVDSMTTTLRVIETQS